MNEADITLSEREFTRVKDRVYEQAGISLSDAKRTLVVSRLSKHVRRLGLASIDAYLDKLERGTDPREAEQFVNALTTNLTRFYREDHHFDHLVKTVAALIGKKPRKSGNGKPRLRIWSAGCSTGQEPYTIALSLMTRFPELKRWDFKVLATDIDTAVVEKARSGIYPEAELNGLSAERSRPFERPGDGTIRVPASIRALITFKPLNLMGNWPVRGPFDAIFCRNVAIYFDKPTQGQLFARFGDVIAPDGFLYIGHSENVGSGSSHFRLAGKTIYQPALQQAARDAA